MTTVKLFCIVLLLALFSCDKCEEETQVVEFNKLYEITQTGTLEIDKTDESVYWLRINNEDRFYVTDKHYERHFDKGESYYIEYGAVVTNGDSYKLRYITDC